MHAILEIMLLNIGLMPLNWINHYAGYSICYRPIIILDSMAYYIDSTTNHTIWLVNKKVRITKFATRLVISRTLITIPCSKCHTKLFFVD